MHGKNIRKKVKQEYLLLELLIAFFLLSLFLAPLLHSPFAYLRKQQKDISSLFLQIEEERLLAQIEEDLRNGTISWNSVLASEKEPVLLQTIFLTVAQDPTSYSAELSLIEGSFETHEEISFGTVKAAVAITRSLDKKKKNKPVTVTLFVLKAPLPSIYAAT
jgi:hypothetical protein